MSLGDSLKSLEKGKIPNFQKYLDNLICLEPLQYSFRNIWKKTSTQNSWNPFPNNSQQPKAALKGSDGRRGAKILGFRAWNLAAGSRHIHGRDSERTMESLLDSRGFCGILWDGIGRCSAGIGISEHSRSFLVLPAPGILQILEFLIQHLEFLPSSWNSYPECRINIQHLEFLSSTWSSYPAPRIPI